MRATVIILSIASAVSVVLFGGLLNAITGLALDIPPAYDAPESGSLTPGASITVSLAGATNAPAIIVQFQSGGQAAGTAKSGCQTGSGA